jgi:hypothetical protein
LLSGRIDHRPLKKLIEATRQLYARIPTTEELAGSGFLPEDYEIETLEIWPENEQAINLFSSISTQWRVGMNGASGLDYNVLFHLMGMMDLPPQKHSQLFGDIRLIESEALNIMNKKPA